MAAQAERERLLRERIEALREERVRLKRAAWEIASLEQMTAHAAAIHALDDVLGVFDDES